MSDTPIYDALAAEQGDQRQPTSPRPRCSRCRTTHRYGPPPSCTPISAEDVPSEVTKVRAHEPIDPTGLYTEPTDPAGA